jgi:hypothetical protein
LPWRWRIILAVLGGIIAPGYTAAWSIASTLGLLEFPLVRFTGALISQVPYLEPAWATPAIWVPVAATAVFTVGAYAIVATRFMYKPSSCPWVTVIAANLVELAGLVAGAAAIAVLGWFVLVGVLLLLALIVGLILGLAIVLCALTALFASIARALDP